MVSLRCVTSFEEFRVLLKASNDSAWVDLSQEDVFKKVRDGLESCDYRDKDFQEFVADVGALGVPL